MELLAAFGAFSLVMWAVFVFGIVGIMIGVDREKYGVSSLFLLGMAVALIYLGGSTLGRVFNYVVANPSVIASYAAIYVGIGIAWAVSKWFFFLFSVRDQLVAFRKNYHIEGEMTPKQADEFRNYARRSIPNFGYNEIPPLVSNNKGRITFWMLWWPFSMPWTIINEPVKRLIDFIYYRIAGLLQRLSDRMFKGLT